MIVTLFICLCHPLFSCHFHSSPLFYFLHLLLPFPFIPTVLLLVLSLLLLSFTLLFRFSSPLVCCCILFLSSSSSFSRSLLFYNLFCLLPLPSSPSFSLFFCLLPHLRFSTFSCSFFPPPTWFHPIVLCTPRSCLPQSERKVHS